MKYYYINIVSLESPKAEIILKSKKFKNKKSAIIWFYNSFEHVDAKALDIWLITEVDGKFKKLEFLKVGE